MIYTITLNPAIDCAIEAKKIVTGETNYYQNSYAQIGGKGINGAIILKNLETPVTATGFLGIENKKFFLDRFQNLTLKNNFVFFDGATRTNYKLKNLKLHQETELNGEGVSLNQDCLTKLLEYLDTNLQKGDYVIAGGSLPPGLPIDTYAQIGALVHQKKAYFILDTSKKPLEAGLQIKPDLIKPNLAEVAEILSQPIPKNPQFCLIKTMVQSLIPLGAQSILLSMGAQGSYFFDKNGEIYQVGTAKGKLVNSVGAGDSMLAGFVYGLVNNQPLINCLQYAAAAGGATAFNLGLGTKKEIIKYLNQINVQKFEGEKWK